MAKDDDELEERGWLSRLRALSVPGALVVIVASAILYFLHDTSGVRREAAPLPTLIATLPPPPPPPPPQQKPPEVEKKVEEEQKPTEQPKDVSPPRQITEAGPAQAGSDAFGIQSGSGDGDVGSGGGFGDATYTSYMKSAFTQAIQNDDRVNRLVFNPTDIAIWIDENGHVTRAEILRSSGDAKVDQDIVAALQSMPALDEPPPSTLEFPQRITVHSRRPGATG